MAVIKRIVKLLYLGKQQLAESKMGPGVKNNKQTSRTMGFWAPAVTATKEGGNLECLGVFAKMI